jgi:tetratricopeptide (TPR) repeat protein
MTMMQEREIRPSKTRPRGPWHRRVEGLHVLKLVGSHYEMGRQHGELLRDHVPAGPIPYYRSYLERMMGRQGAGALSPIVWPLIQRVVGERVAAAMPPYARDSIRGLAEGAEIPFDELLAGCSLPDALVWVAARLMQLKGVGPAMHHRLALGLGCTSVMAWGDATRDGKLLHARNFDYHGVDVWPRSAAVVFHEPSEGLRYVSVAAAGVLMGGITAMNEAGLTLTVHQHMFTDRTRLGGTPIGCVGDVIMREARSLDDAERILRSHRPIGCWTYLVTDGPRRQVLCWEENPDRQVVVKKDGAGGTFGYANIYRDRELGDTELNLYGSYWRHNLGRQRRAEALLAEGRGALDGQALADILADGGETSCRIATAISMVMTVGSVVFRPEDGVLWVGAGPAPTSQRPFLPFDLRAEDHTPELGTIVPRGDAGEAALAYDAYREAYVAYVDESDCAAAKRAIDRAVDCAPNQPLYLAIAGMLALQLGDAEGAFAAFGRALAIGHEHPERLAQLHLWRGRAADASGRRALGLRDYRAALGHHADEPVVRAARRGLRRPYRLAEARKLEIDFTYADVVSP